MKIVNKKASFNYEIIEKYEFGIVLLSSEVKAIRAGSVSIQEAYLDFSYPHFLVYNMFIGNYKNLKHDNYRERIILLHQKERKKLVAKIQKKGLTIVILEVFCNQKGFIKIKCALAVGKKLHDKRASIKERELRKEASKILFKTK